MWRANKTLVVVLLLLLLLANPIYTKAAVNTVGTGSVEQIQLYFAYINGFQNSFSISDTGKASMRTIVTAYDVDAIYLYTYLQQYKDGSWKTIGSWNENAESSYCIWEKNYYVSQGYNYRFKSNVFLYHEGEFVENTGYISGEKWY